MSHHWPSCDTFVALPPATQNGCVVFGKNSDRPQSEVQEVVFYPAKENTTNKLQCTYIEIDEVPQTHAVILSKPAWMWGAEIGANQYGVCIGNEAVWDKLNSPEDLTERLLGMDLVRLGLERAMSAREAVDVLTSLLDKYGQGGPCSEQTGMTDWAYHNSFLIADRKEAWVLETAGTLWAAEHVTEGVRNISNEFSIGTKIDLCSPNLREELKTLGLYDGSGELNFTAAVSEGGATAALCKSHRYTRGRKLLQTLSEKGTFGAPEMMQILRDEDSGFCMTGAFTSTGSQVSVLSPSESSMLPCHWFTATPNPLRSVYKPFVFTPDTVDIGTQTKSPDYGQDDPARRIPRFQGQVNRQHELHKGHKQFCEQLDTEDANAKEVLQNLKSLETKCLEDMKEMLERFDGKNFTELASVFPTVVTQELSLYK
ncbi:secernin-3-like [Haliotis rubra]|uniref:secernin-3-like n=1 Tax=Haliotis rubra TaxID=36100 RepID=UPI001EE57600|nr:secernin-3-like [Haliotis rubra]